MLKCAVRLLLLLTGWGGSGGLAVSGVVSGWVRFRSSRQCRVFGGLLLLSFMLAVDVVEAGFCFRCYLTLA